MKVPSMRIGILLLAARPLLAKTPEWDQARALFNASDFKQAAAVLEKATKKDFDNLVLLGRSYMELKNYGEAVDAFDDATKIQPMSSEAQLWLGRAYGRLAEGNKLLAFGRARKARSAFERAVQLDPNNRDALDDLFEFYFQAPGIVGGGLDKAEGVAKQIAALNPADGEKLLDKVARERKK
jgi:cytochrome c-type biogenesis protein CcmH/NrfG